VELKRIKLTLEQGCTAVDGLLWDRFAGFDEAFDDVCYVRALATDTHLAERGVEKLAGLTDEWLVESDFVVPRTHTDCD